MHGHKWALLTHRDGVHYYSTTVLALVRTLSLQAYPLLDLLPHGPLGGGAVRARGDAPSDLACGVLHLEGDLNGVRVRVRVGVRVGVRVRVRVGVRVRVRCRSRVRVRVRGRQKVLRLERSRRHLEGLLVDRRLLQRGQRRSALAQLA